MLEVKNILAILAVLLTFAGYVPYTKDILKGKTKPHLFSWFLWCFVTAIVFALQVSSGAGISSFVTLSASLMCLVVLGLGIRMKTKRDIARVDVVFLVLALLSLFFWLIAKQPVWSVILATMTDVLGFAPTIRKSWWDPYSETISFYGINAFRFMLATFSLQNLSIITAFYPITWLIANGLFGIMLVLRRKQLANQV